MRARERLANEKRAAKAAAREARANPVEVVLVECIGYLRVSTQEQADSRLGMESQRAKIEALCVCNDWRLVEVHEDAGVSGAALDRPGLQAAVAQLGPGRVLVAAKLDRFTRTVADLSRLMEWVEGRGGQWACVEERIDTSTASGRLMLRLLVEISQWEREVIAERTKAALAQKRVRGERLGGTPLGYRTVSIEGANVMVVDDEEMETVRLVRELRAGGMTLWGICAEMERQGRPTKKGGPWDPTSVRKITMLRYVEQYGTDCPGGAQ